MRKIVVFILSFLFLNNSILGQNKRNTTDQWIKIVEDEILTISYNSNIVTNRYGRHIVWVKAVYHTQEWQNYFADWIGSNVPVVTTITKAEYNDIYSLVMVRQVNCYSKSGKKLYDSGDDRSAGWGYVKTRDPVGIVGDYLGKKYNHY